jgi:hypothetical protein
MQLLMEDAAEAVTPVDLEAGGDVGLGSVKAALPVPKISSAQVRAAIRFSAGAA